MNKVDYILGKAINEEKKEFLNEINPSFLNSEQTKIYNSLITEDFSVFTILSKHGQKTAGYAIEIANESLKIG